MVDGPFNINIDGFLMLPEQPLSQTGSHQNVSIDWQNNLLYSTQIINGGVLLPGEVLPAKTQAERALAGDLAITRFTRAGTITGVMYVRSMGHGVSLNAEPVGSDTYLWMEADSAIDGVFGLGQKVGRLKFTDGATVDSSSGLVQKFDPVPGFRRVFNTIDFQNDRIAVSWADLTPQRNRTYRVYNFTQFKLGIYTPLFEFPLDGLDNGLQNHCLYGDFIYQIEGAPYSGTNPPPGNSWTSVLDMNGSVVQRVFNATALGLNNREPEALNVDHGTPTPNLFFGFSTNAPAPVRFVTLYYWALSEGPVAPGTGGLWHYTTNTVEEAPFAWNDLHMRYRMPRGISVQEVSPGVYEEIRYASYTEENWSENLPRDTSYQNLPLYKDLNFFRGGYEHIVDDQVRANLIMSGVATSSNFIAV